MFGLREVGLARLGQRFAGQRHDPLVALVGGGNVEGDREEAAADEFGERGEGAERRQPFDIVTDIAAQFTVAIVAHQQVDNSAIGLRLHRQLGVVVLEQRADQRSQGQRFGEEVADRGRVVVSRKHGVEHRPEPHDASAGIAIGDGEGEYPVAAGLAFGYARDVGHSCPSTPAAPTSGRGGGFPPRPRQPIAGRR